MNRSVHLFYFSCLLTDYNILDFICQYPHFLLTLYRNPTPHPYLHGFHMAVTKFIRLDKLLPPVIDHRLTDSPEDDDDLMASIKELGVLEPLIVRDVGNGYEVVIGNRRRAQSIRAGLAAVPCIITKATGAEAEKIKLHENIKRLPLSHVDQGYTIARLIKEFNLTESQIATLMGKSIAYVSQHLSLIHCEPCLLESVHAGHINFSTARELIQCKDDDDRHRFQNIVETNGASQYVVQGWVRESNRETASVAGEPSPPPPPGRPVENARPMYPCAACEVPADILKIKTIRMCPECHHLIFNEIDKQKQAARMNLGKNAVPEAGI